MSQVFGINNEPKDANAGGFWKNLAGKLSLPFEKHASANAKQAEKDKGEMLSNGSFTPIGEVKPKELRMVAGGTEITVKTSATQKKDLEGMLNRIVGSLQYLDESFLRTGTGEELVKSTKSYIEAWDALQRALKVGADAGSAMAMLDPQMTQYFQASDAVAKISEIESGLAQLSEKSEKAVPSYKSVVDEIKKKLTDFSDLMDKLVKKYAPSGAQPAVDTMMMGALLKGVMTRKALMGGELDDIRDTINEAVNDLKIANNLLNFLNNESASAQIPGGMPMDTMPMLPDEDVGMPPEIGGPETVEGDMPSMDPAMIGEPEPLVAGSKWSLFKKAKPRKEPKITEAVIQPYDAKECQYSDTGKPVVAGEKAFKIFLGERDSLFFTTRESAEKFLSQPNEFGASKKASLQKKADGTQGTWDIENYKNVDRCRDCAFFQSDPGGTHLNKCHDCKHYKLGGTIDYFTPRSGQIVTVSPDYKMPEPKEKKKAFVGTIGISKEAKKPKADDPIKTQDESLESKVAKKDSKSDAIKTQDESLESKIAFKGTIGIQKEADFEDEHGLGVGVKNKELEMGIEEEKEHTDVLNQIIEDTKAGQLKPIEEYLAGIAEEHIQKIKDYYTRVKAMEDEALAGKDQENFQ